MTRFTTGNWVCSSLVAIVASFVVFGSAESPLPEMCVRASWLKAPSKMRVFKVDEADDYEPEALGEMIRRESWGSKKLDDVARLRKKVLYFAEAKQKNSDKTLDGRFNFKQFLDMNYYDLKTSCTVAKSEEREKFCAEIKTKAVTKRKGDNLIQNLALYCKAMRGHVDTCCEIGIARAAKEELRHDLIRLREVAARMTTAIDGEGKSLDFDEALKQYLNQKDKKLAQNLRDKCERLLKKLEFILANEDRGEKYGFKDEAALCRRVNSYSRD